MLGAVMPGVGAANAGAAAAPSTRPVGQPPSVPPGSQDLGPSSSSAPLNLDVVLAPQDPAALDAFVQSVSDPASPQYHHFLAKGQFGPRFGASPNTIAEVTATLQSEGLDPGPVNENDLIVPVRATVASASSAFHVAIHDYRLPSGRVAHANATPPQVPSTIASHLVNIAGLSDVTQLTPARTDAMRASPATQLVPAASTPSPCTAASSVSGTFTATQLAHAYGFDVGAYNQGNLGAGETVAVFELEPFSATDIGTYQTCYGISSGNAMVNVSTVAVDGGAGAGSGSGESALDIEDVSGLAPAASITVYEAPNTNAGVLDEYARIANDDVAQTVSTSWGLCESLEGLTDAKSEQLSFEQMATQGQSIFAAAGDSGSEDCGGHSPPLGVDDPGSDPMVTSVGGTTMTAIGPAPSEVVWNDSSGAGGGGISSFWAMPSWQTAIGVNANSSGTPCGASAGSYCREVPDVSASASPFHGYAIFLSGKWIAIGGTSAAAPLWGALVALADEGCGDRAGLLNPALYQHQAQMNDITSGNNDFTGRRGGLFPAGTGYDMASGLGTPTSGLFPLGVLCDARVPTSLAVTTEPASSVSADATISLSVSVEDQFGRVITSGSGSSDTIHLAPSSGSFASGTTTQSASGGVATFSGLGLTTAGTYTITASDTSTGTVGSATSTSVTVTPGSATMLVISRQPTDASAGTAFPTQPQVTVKDAHANIVAGDHSAVTLAIANGTPATGGPGSLSGCSQSESQGIVTFSGCAIDAIGTGYALTASDGSLTPATTSAFNVTAGPLARFAVSAPANATAGTTFGVALTAQDGGGNTVTSYSGPQCITFSGPASSPNGALPSYPVPGSCAAGASSVTFTSGVATGVPVTLVDAQSTALHAAGSSVSGTSGTMTVGPAPESALAVTGQPTPSSVSAGQAFSLSVAVVDQFGNAITTGTGSGDTVQVAPSSGSFASGTTTQSASNGVATFSGLVLTTVGSYTVTASDTTNGSVVSATTHSVTVTPGTATMLVISRQPSDSSAGAAFPTQPQVTVEDAYTNTVTGDTSTVTLAIAPGTPTSGASGTLSGCSQTESQGVVTFSGCSINAIGTGYELRATDGSLTPATTSPFNVNPGGLSRFAVTAPANVTAGTSFGVTLTAQDAGGNTVTTFGGPQCITFSGPVNSPNGTAPSYPPSGSCAGGSAVSFANGMAAGIPITLNDVQSTSLLATESSVSGTSGTITVGPAPESTLAITTQPASSISAGSSVSFSVAVEDQFGNVITSGIGSTDAIHVVPSSGSFASGATTQGAAGGVASFSGLTLTAPGIDTVTASDTTNGSVTSATTHSVTVTSPPPPPPPPPPPSPGYWMVGSDGGVFGFGDAGFVGSLPGLGVHVSDIVAMVPTSDGKGYWMVGRDGGVFGFGDAGFVGSLPGIGVHVTDIVAMVPTPDGAGYWMVGRDGGVFGFGDAGFVGSLPGIGVHVTNIVGMVSTADGAGYWMVGSDGGVFGFGDAGFVGSLPGIGVHVSDIVALVPTG